MVQGANVAIADLNTRHLAGLQYRLVIVDDLGDAATADHVCRQAAQGSGMVAVVGDEVGALRSACRKAAKAVPYLSAGDEPGTECTTGLYFVGPTVMQRVNALVAYLAGDRKAKRFALVVGADAVSSAATAAAAAAILKAGARVVASIVSGTGGVPAASLTAIAAARPDAVIDTVAQGQTVAVHRARSGSASARTLTWASVFAAGAGAAYASADSKGVLVVTDYLTRDPSLANQAWLRALVRRYGDGAAPSPVGAEVYDAIELRAAALGDGGAIDGASVSGPRGAVTIDAASHGYATLEMKIGLVESGGVVEQLKSGPALEPGPNCVAAAA